MADDADDGVPRIPMGSMTAERFRAEFMERNLPVMVLGATDGWRAAREWVRADGGPDVARLASLFGGSLVSVVECANGERRARAREPLSLTEYAAWWRGRASADAPLYLKDWHFQAEHAGYGAYALDGPLSWLDDDWLNEHWAATGCTDDHRFVYLGPAGTYTALHADVLFSFSWSVNVSGVKRCAPRGSHDTRFAPRGRINAMRCRCAHGLTPHRVGVADGSSSQRRSAAA